MWEFQFTETWTTRVSYVEYLEFDVPVFTGPDDRRDSVSDPWNWSVKFRQEPSTPEEDYRLKQNSRKETRTPLKKSSVFPDPVEVDQKEGKEEVSSVWTYPRLQRELERVEGETIESVRIILGTG